MKQLNGLYILVLRLTKSEKRYFKLFTQLQHGDRLYWQLYEMIQREAGNDERVRAAFIGLYSVNQFEAARKHLYAVLLKCLRTYRSETDLETKLVGQIQEAQILFDKGIDGLAIAQLRAVQQTAIQYEKLTLHQWALELELTYLMPTEFRGESEESIIDRHEQIASLLRQQIFNHQHTAINHLLLFRYFQQGLTRSPTDDERLNDLLLEEHRINAMPHRQSFESRKLHLHFQAAYFLMTGQYADSLATYGEMNTLFEEQARPDRQEMLYYTYLIDGILTGLKSLRDYGTMRSFLEHVQHIVGQQPVKVYGLAELLISHRMSIYLDQGQFAEALVLFRQEEPDALTNTVPSLRHGQALMLFYGVCTYFGLHNYSASLRLVNQLLHVPQSSLSHTLYTAVRLFELAVHVELGNDEYVFYKIRSVEWKLRSQKRLFRAERLVLNVLRMAVQQGWQHPGVYSAIEELQGLRESDYDSRLNQLFDFGNWLTAKLYGYNAQ